MALAWVFNMVSDRMLNRALGRCRPGVVPKVNQGASLKQRLGRHTSDWVLGSASDKALDRVLGRRGDRKGWADGVTERGGDGVGRRGGRGRGKRLT